IKTIKGNNAQLQVEKNHPKSHGLPVRLFISYVKMLKDNLFNPVIISAPFLPNSMLFLLFNAPLSFDLVH
ncbi:hypothetical protein KI387_015473, partial [Taxus chinensis]